MKDFKLLGHIYYALRNALRDTYAVLDARAGRHDVQAASEHPDIKILQVYYDSTSQRHLEPQFIPYMNANSTKYFADQIGVDAYDAGLIADCDYFGIISWRMRQKLLRWGDIASRVYADNKSHDFYYFTRRLPGLKQTQIWQQGNFLHRTDLTSRTQDMISKLGWKIDLCNLDMVPSYYSYHICRTSLYRDYVENFLKPMMAMMDDKHDVSLQTWLNEDAHYTSYTGSVDVERLRKISGFPYYTKHAFISERLFPTYAALKGWTGKDISGHPKIAKGA